MARARKSASRKQSKKRKPVERSRHGSLAQAGLVVGEPQSFRNLAIYLLEARGAPAAPEFLTLEEALQAGQVWVAEGHNPQVQRLRVDNRGDQPVFLHEGDRVQGGRQDRTVRTTVAVPARSGERPLAAFCICLLYTSPSPRDS